VRLPGGASRRSIGLEPGAMARSRQRGRLANAT